MIAYSIKREEILNHEKGPAMLSERLQELLREASRQPEKIYGNEMKKRGFNVLG